MTLLFTQRLEVIRGSSQGDISITVTDRDGVEIVSCPKELLEDRGKRQNAQIVSTIFSLTHEQCSKLEELGSAKYIISEYGESRIMLQANFQSVVITIEGNRKSVSDAELVEMARRVSEQFSQTSFD